MKHSYRSRFKYLTQNSSQHIAKFRLTMKRSIPRHPSTSRSKSIKHYLNKILIKNHRLQLYKKKSYCLFYCRFGRCNKNEKCPYIHDPDKVAVCTRFLRGTCKVRDCPFSHKLAPEKMPVCSYFLLGQCNLDPCPYRHVKVNPDAPICKHFLQGYCPKGFQCKLRHQYEEKDDKKTKKKDKPINKSGKKLKNKRRLEMDEDELIFIPLVGGEDNSKEPEIDEKLTKPVVPLDYDSDDSWKDSEVQDSETPRKPLIRILPSFLFEKDL